MKKIIIILIAYSLFSTFSVAQCDEKTLQIKPGVLKKVTNVCSGTFKVSAAELAEEKKVLSAIESIFNAQYKPVGFNASYVTDFNCHPSEIDLANTNRYGHPYYYMLQNFAFYCNKGVDSVHANSMLSLDININFGLGVSEWEDISIIGYDKRAIEGLGFTNFNASFFTDGQLPDTSSGWAKFNDLYWITKRGQLPFQYVTRKEFLEKQIAINEAKIEELKKINYPHSMQSKMVQGYKNDLKKDSEWLRQNAIVGFGHDEDKIYRYIFTTLKSNSAVVPIKPNPKYYNRQLKKSAPQYITIRFRGNEKASSKLVLQKIIEDNLDKLANLIAN